MKGLAMRLAAMLLGLALAWAMLEVAFRVVGGGLGAKPRSVAINEPHQSPNDKPHHRYPPKPPRWGERFELLVVGDSFTWGAGVYHQDIWARRLESLLERMDRRLDVELRLISRPGWNTAQELAEARLAVRRRRPDLLLLGYCINDAEPRLQLGNEDVRHEVKRRRPAGIAAFLHRHSRLARVLWERLENSRQRRAFDHYYHALYERQGWDAARQALDGFRQLAWEEKLAVVVAVFPVFDQQLDAGYSYRDLHTKVMAALAERDLPAVDLLPAYAGIDTVRLAVEPFSDPHPNELAHRIASQYLADHLVRQGLVPISVEQLERIELSLPGRLRGRRHHEQATPTG